MMVVIHMLHMYTLYNGITLVTAVFSGEGFFHFLYLYSFSITSLVSVVLKPFIFMIEFTYMYIKLSWTTENRITGVMVSVVTSSAVNRGFESR